MKMCMLSKHMTTQYARWWLPKTCCLVVLWRLSVWVFYVDTFLWLFLFHLLSIPLLIIYVYLCVAIWYVDSCFKVCQPKIKNNNSPVCKMSIHIKYWHIYVFTHSFVTVYYRSGMCTLVSWEKSWQD